MRGHRRAAFLVLVAIVVAFSAGCGGAPEVSASGAGWTATLSWTPPLLPLRESRLRLRLVGTADDPVTIEDAHALAIMPLMRHRGDPIPFRSVRPGRYEALHTFSMDGEWEIRVSGRAKGTRFVTSFRVDVGRE